MSRQDRYQVLKYDPNVDDDVYIRAFSSLSTAKKWLSAHMEGDREKFVYDTSTGDSYSWDDWDSNWIRMSYADRIEVERSEEEVAFSS